MKYNRFEIAVVIQVILLAITGFGLVYAVVSSYLHVTIFSLGLNWRRANWMPGRN